MSSLDQLLRELRLPSFVQEYDGMAAEAERQSWGFRDYLRHLADAELEDRRRRRIGRLKKQSRLPTEKTLATLEVDRLPVQVRRLIPVLCEGGFVDRAENLLAFGLPGRGKTHLVCAVGHELVKRGYQVLFIPAFELVQRLLIAKRDLDLVKELKRLDRYDALCIDDLGYVQQSREEMEVLFTLLAERYERKTVILTSNLVFSDWDKIFKDTMTTAAAIDRVVHHSTILEMTGMSYRAETAGKRREVPQSTIKLPEEPE